MSRKKWLLAGLAVTSFIVGYGVVAQAFPQPYNYGYFYNQYDNSGREVLPPWGGPSGCQGDGWALPGWIQSADQFINFIGCKLGGDAQNHIGAAFIVSTMTGMNSANPGAPEYNEFAARVRYAESQGWINFNASINCTLPNTYYQDGPRDVAATGSCGSGGGPAIIFSGGPSQYIIKRFCANPAGSMQPIADDLNFQMTGTATVDNRTPQAGQTIRFDYAVTNTGPTATDPLNIWWSALDTVNGGQTIPGHPTGTYWVGRVDRQSENYTIPGNTPPGTRICRQVDIHPANQNWAHYYSPEECAVVAYNFNLTPVVTVSITSGGVPIPGNVAEAGDIITFTYSVTSGPGTSSQTITCTYRQQTWPGNNQSAPTVVFTPGGANCPPPRTFPASSTTNTATENVSAFSGSTTICRSLTISPVTQNGGSATNQACVLVANKPYARAWGGDIAVGNGLANSSGVCSGNNNAAIVGWNKRSAGSNAGAGVQFAAYALARITDFASALYDPGGAPSPNGLSFANTVSNPAAGDFGGGFGSAPCIPDYYATRPTTTQALPPNITSMISNVYGSNSNTYWSSGPNNTVSPGERITVYVDGDAYINTNIVYEGVWSMNNAPLFELIVRGNIYIDLSVTQLDGVYVAQPRSNGTGGEIHTCAVSFPVLFQPIALDGNLHSRCNRKLTVNGLFTAKQIRLLRTNGTLAQSNTSEPSTSGVLGEAFNYGPALWIKQPVRQGDRPTPDYDAIISLPPIL